MIGYWNGEHATFKGITYEVIESKTGKLHWQNQFIGKRRQGIEISYKNRKFIIDNENGDGYFKVTRGLGSPRCGHKSIFNPINVEYISDLEVNKKLDIDAINQENKNNRIWAKKTCPELFDKSEALRKMIEKGN